MSQGGRSATEEWKSDWTLILAAFAGFMFSTILASSISVYMGPLSEEFGWSRTLISLGVTMASVTIALLAPFFGILIDRYGSRRVALPGIVVTAIALSAIGLANGSATQWIVLWAIYAVVSIAVQAPVWTAAVAGTFQSGRGLALGVTLAGATAAHTIVPPLSNALIEEFGWRMAYVCLGLGGGAISLLLCFWFFHDAHDRRRARFPQQGQAEEARPALTGLTIQQAWRSSALWRIGIAILIIMVVTIGLLIHQIEILAEAGVSRTNAAWLASLAGAMGIVGKLVTGVLLDRFKGNWIGGITLGAVALAFFALIDGVYSPAIIIPAMLVNGYTAGAKLQIASYLTVRYAGMRNFGKIYGAITSLVSVGSGAGPVVAGSIYDLTGGYQAFLIAGVVGSIIAGLLVLSLPRYPEWDEAQSPATGDPRLGEAGLKV